MIDARQHFLSHSPSDSFRCYWQVTRRAFDLVAAQLNSAAFLLASIFAETVTLSQWRPPPPLVLSNSNWEVVQPLTRLPVYSLLEDKANLVMFVFSDEASNVFWFHGKKKSRRTKAREWRCEEAKKRARKATECNESWVREEANDSSEKRIFVRIKIRFKFTKWRSVGGKREKWLPTSKVTHCLHLSWNGCWNCLLWLPRLLSFLFMLVMVVVVDPRIIRHQEQEQQAANLVTSVGLVQSSRAENTALKCHSFISLTRDLSFVKDSGHLNEDTKKQQTPTAKRDSSHWKMNRITSASWYCVIAAKPAVSVYYSLSRLCPDNGQQQPSRPPIFPLHLISIVAVKVIIANTTSHILS